jgi:hypothetical protein
MCWALTNQSFYFIKILLFFRSGRTENGWKHRIDSAFSSGRSGFSVSAQGAAGHLSRFKRPGIYNFFCI